MAKPAQPLCGGGSGKLGGLQPNSSRGPKGDGECRHWSRSLLPPEPLLHRAGLTPGPAPHAISATHPGTGFGVTFPRNGAAGKRTRGLISPCSLTEALLPSAERSAISWLVNVMNSCTLRGHSAGPGAVLGNQLSHSTPVCGGNNPSPQSSSLGCGAAAEHWVFLGGEAGPCTSAEWQPPNKHLQPPPKPRGAPRALQLQ